MLVRFLVLFSTVIMIAKLCQFICYFKLHLILVFDPAMIGVYALNDLITQISHDVAAGAVFVYWHHGVNEFQYFTMQDNDMYHQELRNLRNQRISGFIAYVMAGEPLVISGNTFNVMEISNLRRCPMCTVHAFAQRWQHISLGCHTILVQKRQQSKRGYYVHQPFMRPQASSSPKLHR